MASSSSTLVLISAAFLSLAALSMPSAEAGPLVNGVISCPLSLLSDPVNCTAVTSVIAGATVQLVSVSGSVITSTTTDPLGSFYLVLNSVQTLLFNLNTSKLKVIIPTNSGCTGITDNIFFLPLTPVLGLLGLLGYDVYNPGFPLPL